MARLTSNKGFTLIEMCMAILIISLLTALYLPCADFAGTNYYTYADAYLLKQSEAMAGAYLTEYQDDGNGTVTFNPKGNVRSAMTLHFDDQERVIVIELGTGRLVFK